MSAYQSELGNKFLEDVCKVEKYTNDPSPNLSFDGRGFKTPLPYKGAGGLGL